MTSGRLSENMDLDLMVIPEVLDGAAGEGCLLFCFRKPRRNEVRSRLLSIFEFLISVFGSKAIA